MDLGTNVPTYTNDKQRTRTHVKKIIKLKPLASKHRRATYSRASKRIYRVKHVTQKQHPYGLGTHALGSGRLYLYVLRRRVPTNRGTKGHTTSGTAAAATTN
jgi:hypothetical protein